MKVCEKVQAKGTTTYNEVADELVNELTDPGCASPTDQQYDQKNIRRRVYDALNVLMAMNIISKEKKEIRWLGLPTNSIQEANSLESDKAQRMERIRVKTQQLQDLILQVSWGGRIFLSYLFVISCLKRGTMLSIPLKPFEFQ